MRAPSRFLVASLALAGCAVGPSTTIDAPAPRAVRAVDTLTAPEPRRFIDSLAEARRTAAPDTLAPLLREERVALDTASDLAWLRILADTTLVRLVQTAVANNRELRAAVATVREFRAQVGATRGDLFPQLTANAAANTNQIVFGAFPPQKFDAIRVTADLAWELDFWGRIRRQTQAAEFDLAGRDADRRAVTVTLVSDVVTAWLELRELDQEVTISEETLASRRASLDLSRQRFNSGVVSELDVRRFEAEAAGAAARLAQFTLERIRAEHRMSLLLGQAPGPIPRGNPLSVPVLAVVIPDSIPGELLLRRPDVVRAGSELRAATARVGSAIGDRLPRFAVTGYWGTQRPDFNQLFDQTIHSAQIGVSIPLFTGGRLVNQQRAAEARVDQARARYEQTVLGALGEADDALAGLRLNRDQLDAQAAQTGALGRALALAQRRYEAGVSSYLEVLDAQRALFLAQLTLAQLERIYLGSTVQLYKALGGAWSMAEQ